MKVIVMIVALLVFSPIFSQSTLDVYCSPDASSPGIYYNKTFLDSNLLEYGVGLTLEPKFKVLVFDDTCSHWSTWSHGSVLGSNNYDTSNFGMYWHYFTYLYEDTTQLLYLDSLINYWLPNDHAIVISTPMEYDGAQIASICPSLSQTLSSKWGASAAQTQSIMILFGVQGNPNSFEMDTITEFDTIINSEYIHFQTQICPYTSQVVGEIEIENKEIIMSVYPNPSSSELNIEVRDSQVTMLKVFDLQGRMIKSIPIQSGQSEYQIENLIPGNYYISAFNNHERIEVIRFVII